MCIIINYKNNLNIIFIRSLSFIINIIVLKMTHFRLPISYHKKKRTLPEELVTDLELGIVHSFLYFIILYEKLL